MGKQNFRFPTRAVLALLIAWLGSIGAWAQKALPYEYGFETALEDEGWTLVDCTSSTGIINSAAMTGSNGFRFFYNTTPPQYLISPELGEATNGIDVSFYYINPSGYVETFMVGYSTTTNDPDAFIWGDEITAPSSWTEYKNKFPAGTKYVAVKYTANDQYRMYIDDFSFEAASAYSSPTNITVDDVKTTTATLSWTAPEGDVTGYAYQYKKADADEWGTETTVAATVTSATLSGLDASTAYDFRVKALFGSDASNYATTTFYTDCGVVTSFPWSEDFEAYAVGNFNNPCWVNEHIEGGGTKIFTIISSTNGSNTTHQLQLPDQSVGTMTMLALPQMSLHDNYMFVLDVYRTSEYNSKTTEGVRVFASANGSIEGATELAFIPRVFSVEGTNIPAEEDTGWYTYELPIPLNGDCRIILRGESQFGASTYMDNFIVKEAPSVLKPTNLAVNYTGGLTAEVTWTSEETAFDIEVNGVLTENVTSPYTLTGLDYATVYEVKVCAKNGNDVSDWAGPVTFNTAICAEEDMCSITFELTDAWGDGWNGAGIKVTDVATGIEIGTVANEDLNGTQGSGENELNTILLPVPADREIQFSWVSGSYDSECSYVVYDVNGDIIFSGSNAMSAPETYLVDCTVSSWKAPTDLVVVKVGGHTAELDWFENGPADSWVVAFRPAGATEWDYTSAKNKPFTLDGLTAETEYEWKVRPETDEVEKWSVVSTFTTDVAAPAPKNLAVSDVTPHTATVTWAGEAESYSLRYREARVFRYNFEQAEPWAVDDFAPCTTYDGDGVATFGFQDLDFTNEQYTGACIAFQNGLSDNMSAHGGNAFGLMINPTSGAADDWFILPGITIKDGDIFSFWAREITNGYGAETINVGVYGDTEGTFASTLDENLEISETVWTEHSYDLSAYVGQTVRLAINCVSSDIFGFMFDDIFVGNPNDDGGWSPIVEGIETTYYDLTELDEGTEYEVQVCGNYGSDGNSSWVTSSFMTPSECDAPHTLEVVEVTPNTANLGWTGYQDSYTVQYRTASHRDTYFYDDFEAGSGDWTNDGSIYYGVATTSGEYFVGLGLSTTGTKYLITPELSAIPEGYTLEFYQSNYGSNATFIVGYSSTTADLEAFTWGSEQATNDSFTLFSEEVPAGTKYIAIQVPNTESADVLLIDDFGIYGEETPAGEWLTATADEAFIELSGLTSDTEYEWQVQGNCTIGQTDWSAVSTFTTEAVITLYDNADNDATLTKYNGKQATVTIEGRTLYRDGDWNTLYLPFDADLKGVLYGATVMELNRTSTLDGDKLTLNFVHAESVQAGVPYIIKWNEADTPITNPVFEGVTINASEYYVPSNDGTVSFYGTYSPVTLPEDWFSGTTLENILFIGNGGGLYYPQASGTLHAFRTFFYLPNTSVTVKEFVLNFEEAGETTGIITVDNGQLRTGNDAWYTLDGRRINSGRPTQKGVYIVNGKKVVIK